MRLAKGFTQPLACLLFAAIASQSASAQNDNPSFQSAVECQRLDGGSVAHDDFDVDNFDKQSEAFLLCSKMENEDGPDMMVSGKLKQKKSGKDIALEDFIAASQQNPKNDVFVESELGVHPVRSFKMNNAPVNAEQADQILGELESRTVTQKICHTEYETKEKCSKEAKETCKIVYGRKQCTTTYEEVCTEIQVPVERCYDEEVVGYYRHLQDLKAYSVNRPDGFCPFGVVEKQSKKVYGRTVNERRCCESKVVDGVLKNVCTDWTSF